MITCMMFCLSTRVIEILFQAVVAASMSDKSPFAVPLGKRAQADSAKATLAVASSDSLTIYKSFLG